MTTNPRYREVFAAYHGLGPFACYGCDLKMQTAEVIHHLDCNHDNNHHANLVPVHPACHRKLHANIDKERKVKALPKLILPHAPPGSGKTFLHVGEKASGVKPGTAHQKVDCIASRYGIKEVDPMLAIDFNMGDISIRADKTRVFELGNKGLLWPWTFDGHRNAGGATWGLRHLLTRGHVATDRFFILKGEDIAQYLQQGHQVLISEILVPREVRLNRVALRAQKDPKKKKSYSPTKWCDKPVGSINPLRDAGAMVRRITHPNELDELCAFYEEWGIL